MSKQTWQIDAAHSEIGFKVKHMMISTVSGQFGNFDATIATDNNDFKNATVTASADIASISTNNKDRDAHLQSADFFDAAQHPQMTFKSTAFDGEKLSGDLTIRGVTKPVTFDVEYNGTAVDPYGNTKAGFEVSGELNRKDFGLAWNAVTEAGGVVVSDKVKINANLQFIKQA